MFSLFKKKEQKPVSRFEIHIDENGEFLVMVNYTGDELAHMRAQLQFRGKRFANESQAENAINNLLRAEIQVSRKYQTHFVKTYP